jgi:hypothetical protein
MKPEKIELNENKSLGLAGGVEGSPQMDVLNINNDVNTPISPSDISKKLFINKIINLISGWLADENKYRGKDFSIKINDKSYKMVIKYKTHKTIFKFDISEGISGDSTLLYKYITKGGSNSKVRSKAKPIKDMSIASSVKLAEELYYLINGIIARMLQTAGDEPAYDPTMHARDTSLFKSKSLQIDPDNQKIILDDPKNKYIKQAVQNDIPLVFNTIIKEAIFGKSKKNIEKEEGLESEPDSSRFDWWLLEQLDKKKTITLFTSNGNEINLPVVCYQLWKIMILSSNVGGNQTSGPFSDLIQHFAKPISDYLENHHVNIPSDLIRAITESDKIIINSILYNIAREITTLLTSGDKQ